MARTTLSTRVDALESDISALRTDVKAILAALTKDEPAKPARTRTTRKAKSAKPKVQPKGVQTRETLTRKDWNRTLTTLAKTQPKGSGAYKAVLAGWEHVPALRDAGFTPREALAALIND